MGGVGAGDGDLCCRTSFEDGGDGIGKKVDARGWLSDEKGKKARKTVQVQIFFFHARRQLRKIACVLA